MRSLQEMSDMCSLIRMLENAEIDFEEYDNSITIDLGIGSISFIFDDEDLLKEIELDYD